MKPGSLPNVALHLQCSHALHLRTLMALGMPYLWTATATELQRGHPAKPEMWREHSEMQSSQMRYGGDRTQRLLGSSSEPCQECPIVRPS